MPSGDASRFGGKKGGRRRNPVKHLPVPMAPPKPDFVDPRANYGTVDGRIFTDQVPCENCGKNATHLFSVGKGLSPACQSCGSRAIQKAEQMGHPARLTNLGPEQVIALKSMWHAQTREIRTELEHHLEATRPGVLEGEGLGSIHPITPGQRVKGGPLPILPRSDVDIPNRDRRVREEVIKRRPDWSQQLDSYINDLRTNGVDEESRSAIEDTVQKNRAIAPKIFANAEKQDKASGGFRPVPGAVLPLPTADSPTGGGRSKLPSAMAALSEAAIQKGKGKPFIRNKEK